MRSIFRVNLTQCSRWSVRLMVTQVHSMNFIQPFTYTNADLIKPVIWLWGHNSIKLLHFKGTELSVSNVHCGRLQLSRRSTFFRWPWQRVRACTSRGWVLQFNFLIQFLSHPKHQSQTRTLSLDAHDMMWLQTKFNKIRPILILQNVHILSNHSPQSAEKGLLTNVNPC